MGKQRLANNETERTLGLTDMHTQTACLWNLTNIGIIYILSIDKGLRLELGPIPSCSHLYYGASCWKNMAT